VISAKSKGPAAMMSEICGTRRGSDEARFIVFGYSVKVFALCVEEMYGTSKGAGSWVTS
jgi:hypothetical protein